MPKEEWIANLERHEKLVGPFADAFVERQSMGKTHPVHDFLFTYYRCSPLKLKQWVPSYKQMLVINEETIIRYPWLCSQWFQQTNDQLFLNSNLVNQHSVKLAQYVGMLCKNVLQHTPRFGCYGLHEWAMVYKLSQEEIRHNGYQLRLSTSELENFVNSQRICCSHYDAYRFFTKEAQPLNVLNPKLETRLQMEQSGCLHTNMDLYKWASKLWPWIGSDFIAKTFLLALQGRELDMRASPYDLTKDGYEPICIETEEGRKQYQRAQEQLTQQSQPLRQELQNFCENFVLAHKDRI